MKQKTFSGLEARDCLLLFKEILKNVLQEKLGSTTGLTGCHFSMQLNGCQANFCLKSCCKATENQAALLH